ncbi:MAG: transglutaminase family protein [Chloroflexi bacterium]|nr:transglutaminase family protein [Chloroflexota bacterium]
MSVPSAARWQAFIDTARLSDEAIDLARASLAIAAIEYPDVDPQRESGLIDSLASVVAKRLGPDRDPLSAANSLSEYLFDEVGFRGNREDYYDARNSYLNDVLRRRLGIPITLSLVYIEVGKRIGAPFVGIGMPGHFLVRHRDVADLFIDPFHGGILLSKEECAARLRQVAGDTLAWSDAHLSPVSNREFLARIIRNLKASYARVKDLERALRMIEWLIVFDPVVAAELRDRGLVEYHLGRRDDAVRDLRAYLDRAPDAADAPDVRRLVTLLAGS